MASKSAPPIDLRAQIIENCRFVSPFGGYFTIVTTREALGSSRAVVLRNTQRERDVFLSASGATFSEAIQELHSKSADATHNYITLNGFAMMPVLKSHHDSIVRTPDSDKPVHITVDDSDSSEFSGSEDDDDSDNSDSDAGTIVSEKKKKSSSSSKYKSNRKDHHHHHSHHKHGSKGKTSKSTRRSRSISRSPSRSPSSSRSSSIETRRRSTPHPGPVGRTWPGPPCPPPSMPAPNGMHPGFGTGMGRIPPPPGFPGSHPGINVPVPRGTINHGPAGRPGPPPFPYPTMQPGHDMIIQITWPGHGEAQVLDRRPANKAGIVAKARDYVHSNKQHWHGVAWGNIAPNSAYSMLASQWNPNWTTHLNFEVVKVILGETQVDLRGGSATQNFGKLLTSLGATTDSEVLPTVMVEVKMVSSPPLPTSPPGMPSRGPLRVVPTMEDD